MAAHAAGGGLDAASRGRYKETSDIHVREE
jgi:hypothetical protein